MLPAQGDAHLVAGRLRYGLNAQFFFVGAANKHILDLKNSVAGAFAIGYGAAKLGDDWSLGFVAETELQVGAHLQSHLDRLPAQDLHSREILQQMQREELEHRDHAIALGARDLPPAIKGAMRIAAKVMTTIAARV